MSDETPKIDMDALSRFNDAYIKKTLHTPDNIYIDIQFLKDFHVAKYILSKDMSSETLPKLVDQFPKYGERLIYPFPFAGFNPNESVTDDQLFWAAPATTFFHGWFRKYFLYNANHSAVVGNRSDINLVINIYPYNLSLQNRKIMADTLRDQYGINVAVICTDPIAMSVDTWLKYDDIFLWYPNKHLKAPGVSEAYSALSFLNKYIYSPRLSEVPVKDEDAFTKDEAVLGVLCTFQFLKPSEFIPIIKVTSNG